MLTRMSKALMMQATSRGICKIVTRAASPQYVNKYLSISKTYFVINHDPLATSQNSSWIFSDIAAGTRIPLKTEPIAVVLSRIFRQPQKINKIWKVIKSIVHRYR